MLKKILSTSVFLSIFFTNQLFANKDIKMLDLKQQNIITISAFTATGDLEKLEDALKKGLDSGLTINEIKEAIVHLYAYVGFPKSLNSLNLFMKTVEERKSAGIKDKKGRESSPLPKDFDKDTYGAKIRAQLAGLEKDISGAPFQVFSPEIDKFLKEHLFADLFARDAIDHKTRELVTISALASMNGTQGQLVFHFGGALNTGLSKEQLQDFIKIIDKEVSSEQAQLSKLTLHKVLESRK